MYTRDAKDPINYETYHKLLMDEINNNQSLKKSILYLYFTILVYIDQFTQIENLKNMFLLLNNTEKKETNVSEFLSEFDKKVELFNE